MKIQHKNSCEIIDMSYPNYGNHWGSYSGYLILNRDNRIVFIYEDGAETDEKDLTDEYEIL